MKRRKKRSNEKSKSSRKLSNKKFILTDTTTRTYIRKWETVKSLFLLSVFSDLGSIISNAKAESGSSSATAVAKGKQNAIANSDGGKFAIATALSHHGDAISRAVSKGKAGAVAKAISKAGGSTFAHADSFSGSARSWAFSSGGGTAHSFSRARGKGAVAEARSFADKGADANATSWVIDGDKESISRAFAVSSGGNVNLESKLEMADGVSYENGGMEMDEEELHCDGEFIWVHRDRI